jgi:hypothetical protein
MVGECGIAYGRVVVGSAYERAAVELKYYV